MANLKLQTGAGGLPAAPNALVGADLIIVGQSGGLATTGVSYRTDLTTAKNFVLAGLTAANVENVPAGNIAATNVQTAINELDTEKAGLALSNIFTQDQFINRNTLAAEAPVFASAIQIVGADGVIAALEIDTYGNPGVLVARRSGGTLAAKTAIANNDNLFLNLGYGWNGATYKFAGGFSCAAAENYTGSVNGTRAVVFSTPVGAATPLATGIFLAGFSVGGAADPGAGSISAAAFVKSGGFTVGTLPAAPTAGAGARTYVTDSLAPAYNVALAAGGAAFSGALSTGAAWVSA